MGKCLEWVYIYRLEYRTGRDTHAHIPVPAGFSGPMLGTLGRNLTYSSPLTICTYVGPTVYRSVRFLVSYTLFKMVN